MSYDEFYDKLQKMKIEYKLLHNTELVSILELESFLNRKLVKPKNNRLKSLKGLSF